VSEKLDSKPLRVLIVGAGAVGGLFGGRLAQAGRDVTFLVRPARAERLRAEGLKIVSPAHGDATIPVQTVTAQTIASPYDVVIFAVKGYTLEPSIADFAPAVGAGTMILPLLNGMRHLDALSARFGADAVIGGYCYCATMLDGEGRVVQIGPAQQLVYGERGGEATARIAALDATMQGARFDARASGNVMHEMWEKWVMLASAGGITCLMRGTTGDVASSPGGIAFSLAFLEEVAATAAASGYPMTEAYMEQKRKAFSDPASTNAPSMFRDLEGGLDVEADQMLGDLVERARKLGVATPLVATAYTNLKVYQRRRKP
jgi:2-dehydropantoate 2-reductase